MGASFSSIFDPPDSSIPDSPQNPSSSPNPDMSSSSSSSTHKHDDTQSDAQTSDTTTPPPDSSIDKPLEDTNTANDNGEQIEGGEEEEQEEGECGFCLFMKGGGCKESFIAWENCVEEAERTKEDVVDKCFEVTSTLRKCMQAHADYYEPILRAEKAAEEEAVKELEKEKSAQQSQNAATN